MDPRELLLLFVSLGLLGGLRLTSTTTTTTFVAAMSIANQDMERYFRTTNVSQTLASMSEERIAMDMYTYAYLKYSYMNDNQLIEVAPQEEKARYGEGRVMNVRGKLVHITDTAEIGDYACSANIAGTGGEPTPAQGVTWIALVRRGRCTFEEKVKNVHAKGAAGVIIYNDKPVMNLEKMQIKGKTRNITAVITYQDVGQDMARIVDQGIEMMAAIVEGRSGMRPINTLNRTSVLFVSISFIVLMLISLVWLVFYYIQRFRYMQTKDQQSRHLCSVTKKAIMKIPTKTGKMSDEKDADSDCCAICIEAYKPSDCIRVLPCKHEFHKNCIDPWLIEHRTCPMCKLDVLKFYGYVFIDSEESILEYEPDRSGQNNTAAGGVIVGAAITTLAAQPNESQPRPNSTLTDLIRSRDFVLDFPRLFVKEAGGASVMREHLFLQRLPERTQSTLSLAHAKDWMQQMSNKLEEQQGLRRVRRKSSVRGEMQENLLDVRSSDCVKRRRSRSADGRYSPGAVARKELTAAQQRQDGNETWDKPEPECYGAVNGNAPPTPSAVVTTRRASSSSALRILTDASYAQSIQRRREELQSRARARRNSQQQRRESSSIAPQPQESQQQRSDGDVAIQIQINGEGVDFY